MDNLFLEALELRRLMAVDLSISYSIDIPLPTISGPTGTANVSFRVTNRGSTDAPFPIGFTLVASADRKLDITTDYSVASGALLSLKGGKASTVVDNGSFSSLDPGRYYLIAAIITTDSAYDPRVDTYGDVNTSNNTIVSRNRVVTQVPEQFSNGISVTENSDKVGIIFSGNQLVIGVNGVLTAADKTAFSTFTVNLLGGNDRLACNTDMTVPLIVNGGTGTDRIAGGAGNDTLSGGDGSDRIFGGAGSDSLHGDGGNDRIFGNEGQDNIFGDGGNDFIYTKSDGSIDHLDGGTGSNSAQYDSSDVKTLIQIAIP